MEFAHYFLYFLALVCVAVPLFGFGLAPMLIVNVSIGAFAGNLFAQIAESKLIKVFIKDNVNNKLIQPAIPALEAIQEQIEILDGERKPEIAHEDHSHHIIPIPVYVGVLTILLVGTFITVAVAQFDFGTMNTVIAMLVATIKASFVLLYFMHLKYDNMENRVIFGAAFFFLLILISLTSVDILTRVTNTKGF
jgi:cytochrome c oxidase subunit 4